MRIIFFQISGRSDGHARCNVKNLMFSVESYFARHLPCSTLSSRRGLGQPPRCRKDLKIIFCFMYPMIKELLPYHSFSGNALRQFGLSWTSTAPLRIGFARQRLAGQDPFMLGLFYSSIISYLHGRPRGSMGGCQVGSKFWDSYIDLDSERDSQTIIIWILPWDAGDKMNLCPESPTFVAEGTEWWIGWLTKATTDMLLNQLHEEIWL